MTPMLSAPLTVTLNITEYCSLSCRYCYANTQRERAVHLPASTAIELAKTFHHKGVWKIIMGGGEPFQHPEILSILENLLAAGVPLALITSGVGLQPLYPRLIELARAFPFLLCIQVSVDGPTPEIHDRTRGAGEAVFAMVERMAEDGLPIQTATVVSKFNVEHADGIVERFYPKIKRFHFMNVMPSWRVVKDREDLRAIPADIQRLWDRLKEKRTLLDKVAISLPEDGIPISGKDHPTLDCPGCTAGYTRADINANGDVVACMMALQSVMGNIHVQSFDEIWRSEKADAFRRAVYPLCHFLELQRD